jgi:hypothetical protein
VGEERAIGTAAGRDLLGQLVLRRIGFHRLERGAVALKFDTDTRWTLIMQADDPPTTPRVGASQKTAHLATIHSLGKA